MKLFSLWRCLFKRDALVLLDPYWVNGPEILDAGLIYRLYYTAKILYHSSLILTNHSKILWLELALTWQHIILVFMLLDCVTIDSDKCTPVYLTPSPDICQNDKFASYACVSIIQIYAFAP